MVFVLVGTLQAPSYLDQHQDNVPDWGLGSWGYFREEEGVPSVLPPSSFCCLPRKGEQWCSLYGAWCLSGVYRSRKTRMDKAPQTTAISRSWLGMSLMVIVFLCWWHWGQLLNGEGRGKYPENTLGHLIGEDRVVLSVLWYKESTAHNPLFCFLSYVCVNQVMVSWHTYSRVPLGQSQQHDDFDSRFPSRLDS